MFQFTGKPIFIVKNTENFHQKDRRQSDIIASHVSGPYKRWHRLERLRRPRKGNHIPKSDSSQPPVTQPGPRDPDTVTYSSSNYTTVVGPINESSQHLDRHTSLRESKSDPEESNQAAASTKVSRCQTRKGDPGSKKVVYNPAPTTILQKGNSEPFSATAIPLTPETVDFFYFVKVWRQKIIWPSETKIRGSRGPLEAANWASHRETISEPSSMHSLLAYGWSWRALLEPDRAALYKEKATQHSIRGIHDLRLFISSNPPAEHLGPALEATMYLGCFEAHRDNMPNVILHRSASKRIIDLMGGLNALSWYHQEIVIHAFSHLNGCTKAHPLVLPQEIDPGSLALQPWAKEYLKDRDLTIAAESIGKSTLDRLLADLRELIAVEDVKVKFATRRSKEVDQIFRWAHRRRYAIRSQHLQYWSDLTERTSAVEPVNTFSLKASEVYYSSLEICLCCAVKLFELVVLEVSLAATFMGIRHCYAVQSVLLRCLQKLGWSIEDISVEDHRAFDLLWIYSVGAFAEEQYLQLSDNADIVPFALDGKTRWFSRRFAAAAQRLKFETFDQVVTFFEQSYAYCARMEEASLSRVFAFDWCSTDPAADLALLRSDA